MFIRGGSDDSGSESAWSEMFVPELKDQEAQTNYNRGFMPVLKPEVKSITSEKVRPLQECVKISKMADGYAQLTDEEIVQLVEAKYNRAHTLEKVLGDHLRGVEVNFLLQNNWEHS